MDLAIASRSPKVDSALFIVFYYDCRYEQRNLDKTPHIQLSGINRQVVCGVAFIELTITT